MSASSMSRAANDQQLKDRVLALAQKEMLYQDTLADTEYGRQLRSGMQNVAPLMYPLAVDTEMAYEAALQAGRGAPGYDMDIITDAAITSSIVAHWPYTDAEKPQQAPDWEPIPPSGPEEP